MRPLRMRESSSTSMRISTDPLIPVRHSLRPPLSSGNSEESQQSPNDVVVVKLVSLPVSSLHLFLVLPVVNVVTPGGGGGGGGGRGGDQVQQKFNKDISKKKILRNCKNHIDFGFCNIFNNFINLSV